MLIEISKELFVPSKYAKPPAHVSGTKPPKIAKHKLPKHIAVVMDGNGRWAKAQGLPRTAGHEAGEAALLDVVHGALELGIPWVSAYAFSTENWKRTPEEVKFLMGFNRDVIRRRRDELHEMGVQVRWVGRRGKLWPSVISELESAAELTRKNTAMTLTMCVNYGGQSEIVDAVKRIAADVTAGTINPDRITEKTIAKYLYDPAMPDVDLFIRSSGEHRTSNFLLWQSSYAELVFEDSMWPDFNRLHLFKAVEEFASRSRRFGSA
jgi:undecaprenyl diphosphate synthase